MVCRDILHVSNLKQHSLAAVPSWAFLASGLGAQWEPPWRSTTLPLHKTWASTSDSSSIPGQPQETLPQLQIPLGSMGTGYRFCSPNFAHLGACQAVTHPNARQILIDH